MTTRNDDRAPRVMMGGTFDPVHYGHLRVAEAVRAALGLATLALVPAADPPHRPPPGASAVDRVAMLGCAMAEFTALRVDAREVDRGGRSYTVDTLLNLRRDEPHRPLAWVVGADAFVGLPTWHRWREILQLAHLVVVARPGVDFATALGGELAQLYRARGGDDADALVRHPAGAIVTVRTPPQPISATEIRTLLGRSPLDVQVLVRLLPAPVLAYIESHHLYGVGLDAR